MNHSAKRPRNKVKTGMTVFVILLSGAGAGVHAYVEPNGATPNSIVLNSEWRQPMASDKKEMVVPPGKSDVMQRKASRRDMMLLHDKNTTAVQASIYTSREQFQSPSDSDKKKFLVLLALWSIKS